MRPDEYAAARKELGWTHQELSRTIGVSQSAVYRFARGEGKLHGAHARLLRLLVFLHLTEPPQRFEQVLEQLRRE